MDWFEFDIKCIEESSGSDPLEQSREEYCQERLAELNAHYDELMEYGESDEAFHEQLFYIREESKKLCRELQIIKELGL